MSTAMCGRLVFGEDGNTVPVPDLPRSLASLRGLGGRAFDMQPGYVYYIDALTKKRVLVRKLPALLRVHESFEPRPLSAPIFIRC
jgi:hypothetical protein